MRYKSKRSSKIFFYLKSADVRKKKGCFFFFGTLYRNLPVSPPDQCPEVMKEWVFGNDWQLRQKIEWQERKRIDWHILFLTGS
jgi:hypothetical protein